MRQQTELVFLGENFGFVCAKYSYTHHSEPKTIHLYWPLSERCSRRDAEVYYPELATLPAQSIRSIGSGVYEFRRISGQVVTLRIIGPNPGQTQAIKIEETAIACPKVRKGVQTRFNAGYGFWEKYLKSDGWVAA